MKKFPLLLILSSAYLLVDIASALAQEEHTEEHKHGRERMALFVGNTHKDGEDALTIGVDYSYRLMPKLSVGGLVDHAGGQLDETLVAGTFAVHPVRGLELLLGAGASFAEGDEQAAVRVGALYEFEFAAVSLSPTVNLDLVGSEEAWVFGLSLGHSFGGPHH